MGMDDIRVELLKDALKACSDEYAELGRTFANLDGKAQATTAIAGIFIAAVFSFIRSDVLQLVATRLGSTGLLLVGLILAALLAAVVMSLICMRIRRLASPLSSSHLASMVEDMFQWGAPDQDRSVVENHLRDQIRAWRSTLEEHRKANEDKANAVLAAQTFLGLAILGVTLLLMYILVNTGLFVPQP